MNQLGNAQAIGGVNEKIEGFFDICAARGLTGTQGVIIPATNKRHLMLNTRVIDAVRDGKFAIYAVRTVGEALALLTGRSAGEPDLAGNFDPGSVYGLVAAKLDELHEFRRLALRDTDEDTRS